MRKPEEIAAVRSKMIDHLELALSDETQDGVAG